MKFFERLLGKQSDPTIAWKAFALPIPDFDLIEMRFGALRFGDTLDAAAFLGRPDRCQWTQSKYCELLYAAGGFQIDYDESRFAYLAFFIGPDDNLPKHEALKFSSPRLRGCTPDDIRLSTDSNRELIEKLFGITDLEDSESKEVILFYSQKDIEMEFEMDGKTGRLKRWNLYPKWYSPIR